MKRNPVYQWIIQIMPQVIAALINRKNHEMEPGANCIASKTGLVQAAYGLYYMLLGLSDSAADVTSI
jgi:hypothetical protein